MGPVLLRAAALALTVAAAGCAVPADRAAPQDADADVVLLGEQHDAASHVRLHQERVAQLAAAGRLAALAVEMAPLGASTAELAPSADEDAVRHALQWNEQAWPWARYAPAVMTAVRAGVPVLGTSIGMAAMRAAMGDEALDTALPPAALERQRQAIASGHCELLPPAQVPPMTRIQIARDQAMARVIASAAQPGRTVVLIAGGGHVDAELGVPRHLPSDLRVQSQRWPGEPAAKDYCAQLREQMQRR